MLFKKLLLSYILLLGAVFLFMFSVAGNTIRELVDVEMTNISSLEIEFRAGNISTIIEQSRSGVLSLCRSEPLQQYLSAAGSGPAAAQLEPLRTLSQQNNFKSFELYPLVGEQLCALDPATQTLAPLDTVAAQDVLRLEEALLHPQNTILDVVDTPYGTMIRLTKSVYDQTDYSRILGVGVFYIDAFPVISVVNSSNSHLFLLDGNGNPIYPYTDYKGLLPAVSQMEGDAHFLKAQGHYLFSYPIPLSRWKLVGAVPETQIIEKGQQIQRNLLTVGIAMLSFAVLTAFLISYGTTKPIMKLARVMKSEVQGGKLNLKPVAYPGAKGEIATLYDSFNLMIDHVESLIDEIYETKEAQRQAELHALQAQINPHFIYNTLDSIRWMAVRHQAEDIQHLVTAFATMLRRSLNNGGDLLFVKNELEHVKSYIEIQKCCYADSFEAEYQIDDGILYRQIIKLILQPLVENAIIHGFAGISFPGKLIVKGFEQNGYLIFEVWNNGHPIDVDSLNDYHGKNMLTRGYGIQNVNERLIGRYGADCVVRYRCEGEFSIAQVRIPLQEPPAPGLKEGAPI